MLGKREISNECTVGMLITDFLISNIALLQFGKLFLKALDKHISRCLSGYVVFVSAIHITIRLFGVYFRLLEVIWSSE